MNEEKELKDMQNKILICSDSKSLKESIKIILGNEYQLIPGTLLEEFKEATVKEKTDVAILETGVLTDTKVNFLYKTNTLFSDLPFIILLTDYNEDKLVNIFGRKNRIFLKIPSELFDLKENIEILLNEKMFENVNKARTKENITENKYLVSLKTLKLGKKVINQIEKTSLIKVPVLISGERGTGRELTARTIHYNSFKKGKFVNINCSSLTNKEFINIFKDENESGLQSEKTFYRTLYFNEIEKLSYELQMMLSEFIDLGGMITEDGKLKTIDDRIIVSTERNLFYEMRKNRFAPNLFYKISLFIINISPLRERKDEIPSIVDIILSQVMECFNIKKKSFTQEAMELFQNYLWPQNFMELENIVLRSVLFYDNEVISADNVLNLFGDIQKKLIVDNNLLPDNMATRPGDNEITKPYSITDYNENLVLELAHEIKNPLVAIKTFANLLPENYSDPDFRESFYKIVSQDVEKIDSLVENILEYQKVVSVKGETKPLSVILNRVINSFSNEFEKRKIFIYQNIDDNLSEIGVENNKFEFAVKNIILKLIKELEKGGEINFVANLEHNNDLGSVNLSNNSINFQIKAKSIKSEDDEISQVEKDKDLEMMGIEIFLAGQLIKYSCGEMTVNNYNNNGIEINILLPKISSLDKEVS